MAWWSSGTNDLSEDEAGLASSLQFGITLVEAERIVRDRDSAPGVPQVRVADQLDAALR